MGLLGHTIAVILVLFLGITLAVPSIFIVRDLTLHRPSKQKLSLSLEASATTLGFKKLIVEGDNLAVINAINGIWQTPWTIKDIIEDIRDQLLNFDLIKISHCYREGNKVADFLASKVKDTSRSMCNPMLRDFNLIIRQDVLGCTSF